jgi:hypothetical protein
MLGSWIVIALCLAPDGPKPRTRPAAMVVDLKGKVSLRTAGGMAKSAEIGELLYPDERIAVPADGTAIVAVLGQGTRETLRSGTEATVGPEGCTPAEAVVSRARQPKAVAATMKGVRPAPGDARKAGVALRAGPAAPPAITPVFGATVATDRPALAWPPTEGARRYRVKLLADGSGRELWRSEVQAPRADFPTGKEALRRGNLFRWEVTDQDFRPVASGRFAVATAAELMQLEELKQLADSGDRADRLSAVLAYRRLGAYAEARAACERLARETPSVQAYQAELADLTRMAGLASPPE